MPEINDASTVQQNFRRQVRALFVLNPDADAQFIHHFFSFAGFGVPENWLEIAAEEKLAQFPVNQTIDWSKRVHANN